MGRGSKAVGKWLWGNFSEDELKLILKRAQSIAKRWGYPIQEAEDAAVDTLIKAVEKGNHWPTSSRSVMNEIKRRHGRVGEARHTHREQLIESYDWEFVVASSWVEDNDEDTRKKREAAIEKIELTPMNPINRAIALLAIRWGFRANEIGECFGFTHGKVLEILKDPLRADDTRVVQGRRGRSKEDPRTEKLKTRIRHLEIILEAKGIKYE